MVALLSAVTPITVRLDDRYSALLRLVMPYTMVALLSAVTPVTVKLDDR